MRRRRRVRRRRVRRCRGRRRRRGCVCGISWRQQLNNPIAVLSRSDVDAIRSSSNAIAFL